MNQIICGINEMKQQQNTGDCNNNNIRPHWQALLWGVYESCNFTKRIQTFSSFI